ncbi:MAG: PepSY domain-containing protein [Lentihominibacter sp.]|jgi:uncharacterized membrane protein YkoI
MKRVDDSKNRILTLIMAAILCGSMLLFCACEDNVPDDEDIEEVVTETTAATTVETPDSKKSGKSDSGENGGNTNSAAKEKRSISMDEAINIALARVPGATRSNLLHIEKDNDDGRISYEGEIYYNGVEYEFKIDASNGNILEWEIDD